MAYLLTLAKSYKTQGRCIAGRLVKFSTKNQLTTHDWIRPIPNGSNSIASVPHSFCNLKDNKILTNLDIIEIGLTTPSNVVGQPENYFFDPNVQWRKVTSLVSNNIFQFTETPINLWLDQTTSIDKCSPTFVQNHVQQSLFLIQVINLEISLSKETSTYDGSIKTHTLASFEYNNQRYEHISITCPAIRKMLKNQFPKTDQPANVIRLKNADDYVLCISLGPEFNNYHYKFIASIFDRTGYIQGNFNS